MSVAQRRITGLDLLRGLAVGLVIIHHAWPTTFAGAGIAGVVIFFALSGYLITGVLLSGIKRASGRGFGGRSFYAHRAFRLYPALLAMLFVFAVVVEVANPTKDKHLVPASLLISALYLTDIVPARHVSGALGHLWSLAIEEQFYLVWPWVLLAAEKRKKSGPVVLVAVVLAWAVAALSVVGLKDHDVSRLYELPTSWTVCLLIGSAARIHRDRVGALAARAGRPGAVVALLIVFAFCVFPNAKAQGLTYAAGGPVLAFCGVLLIGQAQGSTRQPSRLFAPLLRLGTISYAAYLWSYPITIWLKPINSSANLPPAKAVFSIVATLVAAELSWVTVEKLGRTWRARFDAAVAASARVPVPARPVETGPRRLSPRAKASLNLLRAIAATYVPIYHVVQNRHVHGILKAPFQFGQEAVIIFFLLSGFVIFANESNRVQTRPQLVAYYLRRLRRIYPLLLISVAVSIVIAEADGGMAAFRWKAFFATVFPVADSAGVKPGVISDPLLANDPLWSLGYELLFYAVFPLLMVWMRRNGPRSVLDRVGIISCLAFFSYLVVPNHFSLVAGYLLMWWSGAELAQAYANRSLSLVGIRRLLFWNVDLCVVAGLGVVWKHWHGIGQFPGLMLRHFAFALVCVALTATPLTAVVGSISMRVARFAAAWASISYGIYVLHFPLLNNWRFAHRGAAGLAGATAVLLVLSFLGDRVLNERLPSPGKSSGASPPHMPVAPPPLTRTRDTYKPSVALPAKLPERIG